jgi:hypothetical protein
VVGDQGMVKRRAPPISTRRYSLWRLRFHKIGTQPQLNRHERRLISYHGH